MRQAQVAEGAQRPGQGVVEPLVHHTADELNLVLGGVGGAVWLASSALTLRLTLFLTSFMARASSIPTTLRVAPSSVRSRQISSALLT